MGRSVAALLGQVHQRASYRRFLIASYSESTKRAYAGDVAHFRRWGGRIPATPMQIARYLAAYAGKQSFATLSRRVAGLHREHLAGGYRSPARSELVRATLRGIARVYTRRQRQMRPLLPEHLQRIVSRVRGPQGVRDRALLLVGFFGGFRRSELAALDIGDIQFGAKGAIIMVRRSKTDQEGEGRVVRLPRIGGRLCPVAAMRSWLKVRPQGSVPLLTTFTHQGRPTDRRMSGAAIAQVVKRRVREIGQDPDQFAGHSLRAGFVTSAARAGAAAWQIKQQTGHKTDAVVASYIRDGALAGERVARLLCQRS